MFGSILARRRAAHTMLRATSNTNETEQLFGALVNYGLASDVNQIAAVKGAYAIALKTVNREARLTLWPRLTDLIAQNAINPNALLAMAICDSDPGIAATCALDFVCFSPLDDSGRPRGILEFMGLFPAPGIIANPGAVFGGLLALGDQNLASFYRGTTRFLTASQIQAAGQSCRSGRLFHAVIDYWLWLLETLIEDQAYESLSAVGYAAAAIVGLLDSAEEQQVELATRGYPCTLDLRPVASHQIWSISEYASEIAPRLRAIADREPPPNIMPDVLRAWGIVGH